MIRRIALVIFASQLAACTVVDSLVYKLPKQQGNITEYEELDKLEIGMTKPQVKFIMGTPMTISSFDRERWDYAYSFKSAAGVVRSNKLTLFFVDGKLSKIDGKPLVERPEDKDEISGQKS